MTEISAACGGGEAGRRLVPGSLRGYRTWRPVRRRVQVPEGALPLMSVTRRVVWPPTLIARCTPSDVGSRTPGCATLPADHRAPRSGCKCGVYAWYAPDDTRILHARVFGAVEASGLVLMGDRGFRAEKVEITAVSTRNRRVAAACAGAGIPVYRRRAELVRAHPPDDLSSLLPDRSPADASSGSVRARSANGFDRTLVLAVWARTGLIMLAIGVLPTAAVIFSAVVAEAALVALMVTRLR